MKHKSNERVYEVAKNEIQKQWLKQHFDRIYSHYVCLMRTLEKHPRKRRRSADSCQTS